MDFIQDLWVIVYNNILSCPAIFIGLIVMAGYTLLKKWYEVLFGFIKAVAGYMILQLGAKSMVGASNSSYNQIDSNGIVSTFMEAYQGKCQLLHSPMIVKNKIAFETLKNEEIIKNTLDIAKNCDLVVCGIGNLIGKGKISTLEGYVTQEEHQELIRQQAIGIIAGEYFDQQGNFLRNSLSEYIIGTRITELSPITKKLIVAGGFDKSNVLRLSLKKGLITHLITDDLNSHKL